MLKFGSFFGAKFSPPQSPAANVPATSVTMPTTQLDPDQFRGLAMQTRGGALVSNPGALGLRRATLPEQGYGFRDDRLGVDPRPSNGQH